MDIEKVLELSSQCQIVSENYRELNKDIREHGGLKEPLDFQAAVVALGELGNQITPIVLSLPAESSSNSKLLNYLIRFSNALSKAIILDGQINQKLLMKTHGGAYGFFEHRKDIKQLNEVYNVLTEYEPLFSYTYEEEAKKYKQQKSVSSPAVFITSSIVKIITSEEVKNCINNMVSNASLIKRNNELFASLLHYAYVTLLVNKINGATWNNFITKCVSEYRRLMNYQDTDVRGIPIHCTILSRTHGNSQERLIESMERSLKGDESFTANELNIISKIFMDMDIEVINNYPN